MQNSIFFSLTDSKRTLLWAQGGSAPAPVPSNTWSCYDWSISRSAWTHRLGTRVLFS